MAAPSTRIARSAYQDSRQRLLGWLLLVTVLGAGCLDQQGLPSDDVEDLPPPTPTPSSTTPTMTAPTPSTTVGPGAETGRPASTGKNDLDLVGYWPFDDGNRARAADLSGKGHHGTVLEGQPTPGVSGLGMAFTGYGSGVDIEDGPDFEIAGSFTIEAWFKATRLHDGHNLIFFRGDSRPGLDPYFATIYPDGTLRFAIQNEANDVAWATAPVSLGEVHHMAAVFDSQVAALNLYVDGQLRTTTFTLIKPMQRLDLSEGPGIGIGHHAQRSGNDYGFIGTIDEVRLYRRALTAAEVGQHFSAASPPIPSIL